MANFYLVLIWHLGLERLQVARRTWYWCRGGSFRGPEDDTAIFLRLNPSPNFCKTLKLHHLLLKFKKSFCYFYSTTSQYNGDLNNGLAGTNMVGKSPLTEWSIIQTMT